MPYRINAAHHLILIDHWCSLCLESRVLLEAVQEICEFHIARILHRGVSSLNQALGKVFFEPLEAHDLLFEGVLHYEAVDTHLLCLADSVSAVYCLEVSHWVPIVFSEDNGVCSG